MTLETKKIMTITTAVLISSIALIGAQTPIANALATFLFEFGTEGSGLGEFENIVDVAVTSNDDIVVYDSDDFGGKIQVYDSAGVFQFEFGTFGTGPGEFGSAEGIAVDSADNIIVGDEERGKIIVFDSLGVFDFEFGTLGEDPGEIGSISDIAVDSADNIYVTDQDNIKVLVFDSLGNFDLEFGSEGLGPGQFTEPAMVEVDSTGRILVGDPEEDTIQVYDDSGVYQFEFGAPGAGDGEFNFLLDLAIDSSDNIFAADAGNNRIQAFDSAGVFQFEFGELGTGSGTFDSPESLAVNSLDDVLVGDVSNFLIQAFQTSTPPMNPDTDSDGIYNEIDLQPAVFSDDFDDTPIGGTSDGNIVTRGDQVLTITEEANPTGVKTNADISGGVTPATVEFCSAMSSIDFDPGDESITTCSSVTVSATSGQLDVTFFGSDSTEATTNLNQGNTVTFDQDDFSFTAPATNTEDVVISVNGIDNPIAPGFTVLIPLQTANPDSDPTVRWVNGIGPSPCTDLNTFNCVDETFRDDSDFIQTIGLGKNNSDKQYYTLSDITDPLTSDGHVLRYTISEADVGANPVELDIILRQGETVIASFHHENLPTGFTLIEQTLTPAQADAITDYSDLELTLDGNCDKTCKNSPGNREKIQVSWIEFAIMATS